MNDSASQPAPSAISLRPATPRDAAAMWSIAGDSVLEQNTAYAYVLFASHFQDTCVVAESGGEIVGFVVAYRPPRTPDRVFVWQVGVRESARGAGIASKLLDQLVAQLRPPVLYLEATVTPSNAASRRLFESFARRHDARCGVLPGFAPELFPETHDPEDLFRIGPLPTKSK